MNPNESFLSTVSTANPSASDNLDENFKLVMARVVANVVDMQQHLVNQYQTVVTSMESLKNELHTCTQSLREDLRRTDDRAQKQVDDLRATHANEVERLMDLIKTLLIKDTAAAAHAAPKAAEQPRTPAQIAYANAAPAGSFFGASAAVPNDLTAHAQYMAYYMQQLQEQQRLRTMGAPSGFFGSQTGVGMGAMGIPGTMPQSQHPMVPVAATVPTVPKPPTVAPPIAAVPPVAVTTSAPISIPAATVVPTAVPATTSTPSVSTASTTAAATSLSALSSLLPTSKTGTATATVQPKVEPSKTEATPPKPAFSFITPKPATTPAVSESKPAASIFSGVKQTENIFSKTPESKSVIKKEQGHGDGHDEEEHEHVDEFEPQVDFKPVCPLPELVKVVTGEEDEKVLFEERCKLYRFADETKEWKERGTGTMKVLENPKTNKFRIVMRREQVHKVCANHQLLAGMTIQQMPRQEKAMMWYCEDFSEEEKSHEKLSARFASVEIANKFKDVFENAVKKAGHGTPVKPTVKSESNKSDEKVTKEKGEETSKGDSKATEVKADEKKGESASAAPVTQKGYGDQFKLQAGQWECPECYSRTDADKCPCCGAPKGGEKTATPATKSVLPASTIPLGGTTGAAAQQKFTFGLSAAAAAKDSPASASNTPKSSLFGASLATSASGSTPTTGFTFGSKPSIFGGATTKSEAIAEGSTLPTFSFAKKPDAASTVTSTSTSTTSAPSPVTFSFKQAGSAASSPSTASSLFGGSKLFGTSKPAEEKKDADKSAEQPKTEQKIFGSGFSGNLTFASLAKSSSGSIFDSAHTQKAQAEFAAQAKSKVSASNDELAAVSDQKDKEKGENKEKAGKGGKEDGETEHGADEEYEPDVQFAPVIPLPDLVDVVTGEEEEEVVFTARAKLFRFIKETKENKERGVGDLKILRNPKTKCHRVVMRREQVYKVCANFAILPSIELNEKKGMPNVYNWVCRDYSESPEGTDEIFTAKFKTAEIAKEFHDKFIAAAAAHPGASK